MAKRGTQLTEHILWAAKDVFLEMGFERASMDVVAARAETSKRTLYAHFESKEKLYSAVVELVRQIRAEKLRSPADYAGEPAEAITMFCARFLEMMLYRPVIQMCRMSIAEAERFPEGAAQSFDVLFAAPQEHLAAFLKTTFGLSPRVAHQASEDLIGRILQPRFPRALFGLDPLNDFAATEPSRPNVDLKPIRKAVADLLESLA